MYQLSDRRLKYFILFTLTAKGISDIFCKRWKNNLQSQKLLWRILYWSTRLTTVPAGSDHYFHTECGSVCLSVRPPVRLKTSKSSDNHCRPGLWAGRVDHWWLLSCNRFIARSWYPSITFRELMLHRTAIIRKIVSFTALEIHINNRNSTCYYSTISSVFLNYYRCKKFLNYLHAVWNGGNVEFYNCLYHCQVAILFNIKLRL